MALQCGIVGLPNVGKSTLFNALTAAHAEVANYPFCTIEPNVGVVPLKDPRLDKIAEIIKPDKVTPTSVEFLDIAGLVKGASHGEGLGNQFLGQIRNVDAIVEVVRCFEDPNVAHVHEGIDPLDDIEVVQTELALADLETIAKRIHKVSQQAKSGDKEAQHQLGIYERIQTALEAGEPVRSVTLSKEEWPIVHEACLLTAKPILYVANVDEADVSKDQLPALVAIQDRARGEGAEVIAVSAKIEAELVSLSEIEQAEFIEDLGLKESGLDRLAHAAYHLLGFITFFSTAFKQLQAWTIREGTHTPQAAGVIHGDFEKHFIRAEVSHYDDLVTLGSEHAVKEAGKLHIEGKDYVVQDGDVIYFRTSA